MQDRRPSVTFAVAAFRISRKYLIALFLAQHARKMNFLSYTELTAIDQNASV